jgi:hypothetical protein
MVDILWKDKGILARALGLDVAKVWFRGREYVFDASTDERADLVFQDRWDACRGDLGATCFVVELKSDAVDHEVLGQLKKAVDVLDRVGKSTKHWGRTVGIAVGKKFTASGLNLLSSGPYFSLVWSEVEKGVVKLNPVGPVFRPGYVSPDGIIRKARKNPQPTGEAHEGEVQVQSVRAGEHVVGQ